MSNSKKNIKSNRKANVIKRSNQTSSSKRNMQNDTEGCNFSKESKHTYNDVSWYAKNAQILNDAASISFNNPVGTQIDYGWDDYSHTVMPGNQSSPGVMVFNTILCPGLSVDNSSAVNIAARNIYSWIRHANSGHSNYDSPDLMMYLLAMDNLYAFYNWMKRTYGIMRKYSLYNRYTPSALVAAINVDYNDLQTKLSDFRYYINQFALKLNALAVPATMSLLIRHSWMFSNVYTDGDTEKSQLYLYNPVYFYQYDEVGNNKGGQLVAKPFPGPMTLDSFRSYGDALISAVIESEDLNIMSGDILKAYGESSLFKLSQIEPDYIVDFVKNEEVLLQMHNIKMLGAPLGQYAGEDTSLNIVQDPNSNAIIYNPNIHVNTWGYHTNAIINTNKQVMTPADTMVATRLVAMAGPEEDLEVGMKVSLHSCGSEFVNYATVHYADFANGKFGLKSVNYYGIMQTDTTNTPSYMAMLEKFDWHPEVKFTTFETATKAGTVLNGSCFDLDNYAVVYRDTMKKMHDVAILSEFGVPTP